MKRINTALFCILLIASFPILGKTQANSSDSLALVALYNATDGANWTNTWDLAQPMDTWNGVNLDGNGYVTRVNLVNRGLDGIIPPEIGNLNNLRELRLYDNQLSGSIPVELGNLTNLFRLYLSDNQLSGSIPSEIGNLTDLWNLSLYNNQLSGCYDTNLLNLPLSLGTNAAISDGNNFDAPWEAFMYGMNGAGACTIPVYDCHENDSLVLIAFLNANNQLNWDWDTLQPMHTWYGVTVNGFGCVVGLYGGTINTILPEIGNLNSLRILDFSFGSLSGSIPPEIGNLSNLTELRLAWNQLSGIIPPEIGNLTKLTDLWLGTNQLTGNLPPEIGNLNNLGMLSLEENQLAGNIPPELGNLNNLYYLDLSSNNLSICCYDENLMNLCQLGNDSSISSGNNFDIDWEDFCNYGAGTCSPTPCRMSDSLSLIALYNATNGADWTNTWDLNQPMDTWYGVSLCQNGCVKELNLSSNGLIGNIPPEIGNLNSLIELVLAVNQLSGSIPSEIGNLNSLKELRLQNNNLSGSIPLEIENLNILQYLVLSLNNLSGIIPDLSTNWSVSLSRNNFSHEDILANYAANSTMSYFYYTPQYHGEVQPHIITLDTTLTLELSTPLPGNNNQNVSYQWQKNDIELVASTDSVFTITNLQISDVGKYTLHMTDSTRVADLEVISEPIYVVLPGYDLYGQPVSYAQVMMEFDDEADRIDYENEHLYPNAGIVQDSCSCNRELYLWQFPNDTVALQVLLDINTRTEGQSSKADVDGGPNNIFSLGVSNNTGTAWDWTGDYSGDTYPDSVRVYLMDSGLDAGDWNPTPYLLNAAPVDDCHTISAPGYGYTDSTTTVTMNYQDSLGHGTYGFRAITEGLDNFMDIKAVPLKVFDQSGEGTLFKFVCALYHAIDHEADIINISAGYRGQPSGILESAVREAHQKGIFIVTAAGNDGVSIDSIPQFPAYYAGSFYETYQLNGNGIDTIEIPYDNVISVAALNAQDSLSWFSNYGNAVTLSAYGENMSGYGVGGVGVVSSGTSMSTFYVTRELATEIAKNKNRSHQQIWSAFEALRLVPNAPTSGLTSTGKRLDIGLNPACLPTLLPGGNITSGTYHAGYDIQSAGLIPSGNTVNFKAGQIITLDTGFSTENQASLSVEIEECSGGN